ncbi:MAG: transporter [Chitinophagaceae bacterium]|nr:transporter [Chitinophagaceae bacterium]
MGSVSMRTANFMGNYGFSKKLNIIASLPFVRTKASAGTLGGQKGLQDFSLWLKWRALKIKTGRAVLSFYALGGLSFPVSDYTADFMPLSIGNESTNVSVRIMTDYLSGKFFITGSGTYVYRDNIKIDRSSYYTTHMHLTNEVEMPNAASFNLRTGYRSKWLILEAVVNNWTTLGGFDITRNNMPFPSNRMNATTLGAGFKYTFRALSTLSVIGGASTTVSGRNVGQSKGLYAGIFYNIRFSHRKESTIHSRSK